MDSDEDDHSSSYDDPRNFFSELHAANPNIPIPEILELRPVKTIAKTAVAAIFDTWERLKWIVERYEPVLQRRWTKKIRERRMKILLAAWPNMSSTHRPDFYALQHESTAQRRSATRFRDAYLFPYINLEDLSKLKNLPLFFNSRGRHTPDSFSFFDLESHHLGRTSAAIVPAYLQGYTMLLAGQKTRQTYGRIVSWDEDDDAFDMMMTGLGVQPGDGLILFEIQERVLKFLVRCAEAILPDIPLDQNAATPVVSATGSDLLNEEAGTEWCSLAASYAEAPYRTPMQLDIARLRRLASAKRAEAEDHIWALREDPGYFQENLQDQNEHRQECIPTLNGKRHPDLGKPVFCQRVILSVVGDAYGAVITWDIVLQELTRLQGMRDRCCRADTPMWRLPPDYEAALWHFSRMLDKMLEGFLVNLRRGATASPPLRKYYTRKPQDTHNAMNTIILREPSKPDPLLWLLESIMDPNQALLCGLSNLLDELERLTSKDPVEHERISGYTARTLSELAAMAEIKRNLDLHQPRVGAQSDDDTGEASRRYLAQPKAIFDVLFHADLRLVDIGTPFAMFDYPSGKKRTRPVYTQLCIAESNLNKFWGTVDAHSRRQTGKTLHEMLPGVITDRELQRLPPWTEPASETVHAPTIRATELFSHLDLEERTQRTVAEDEPPPVKTKIKTRGITEATPLVAPERSAAEATPEDLSPATFKVTRRAHKVFSALFPTPGAERGAGDLPWKEFLYALASVGFSITKLDGSAWVFQPSWAQERPIIFHEPHPESRIQFHHLRRHGRRLGRTYGWDCHTFELVEKK